MAAKVRQIYLDTNAFRYFGEAFANDELPYDLRTNILISPLSAFEVLAQLAQEDCCTEVLQQIKSIRNWTDPAHSGLLPWPADWLYQIWHRQTKPDDGFTKRMQDAFNLCITSDSPDARKELLHASAQHAKLMDNFKLQKAQEFKAMIDEARKQNVKQFDMTETWFVSIAKSVGADSKSRTMAEIVSELSAHHEFEQSKLQTALASSQYNPLSRKNQNDIIDADQLVYLADESLCMLTADGGFKSKVTKSNQATRIITAPAVDLMNARKAEAVIKAALQ